MHRIFKPFIFSLVFSALITGVLAAPPPATADCYGTTPSNTSPSIPTCVYGLFGCAPDINFPNYYTDCCDTASECPAGTTGIVAAATMDPTQIFCNTIGTIRTAIGCINAADPEALINQIVLWSLGLAAASAFISIAYAGFLISTAQGDVKKVNEAKSFLSSALLGLLLISVALLLLNFVGVRILSINSFGFNT